MLKIEHLTKRFGGLLAVNDVSTTIETGKINAIIGPNGAGRPAGLTPIKNTN